MACRNCKLKRACRHFGGVCPWVLYLLLAALVSVPGFLLWRS
jgi:hypothetical protein